MRLRRQAERFPHVHDGKANTRALPLAEPCVQSTHARLGAILPAEPDRPPANEIADPGSGPHVRESSKLIERGPGYTVLPPSTIVGRAARIKAAPVRGLSVTWALGLNRDRAKWPAVRVLEAMIREQAEALIKSGAWKASRKQDSRPSSQKEREQRALLFSDEKDAAAVVAIPSSHPVATRCMSTR